LQQISILYCRIATLQSWPARGSKTIMRQSVTSAPKPSNQAPVGGEKPRFIVGSAGFAEGLGALRIGVPTSCGLGGADASDRTFAGAITSKTRIKGKLDVTYHFYARSPNRFDYRDRL
jgi:hypothetical protein